MSWLVVLAEPVALIGWGLVVLIGVAYRCRSHRAVLAAAVFLTYFWFATPLGANLMVAALEQTEQPAGACETVSEPPVVVVLGGGLSGFPATVREFSRLQEASFRRTVEAVHLAEQLPGSTLVISGGAGGDIREADLMRSLAEAIGFPENKIVTERHSQDTFESAVEVARILRSRNISRVQLVTSAMHMPRAAGTFRAQGLGVCSYPVDRKLVPLDSVDVLVPQISALAKSTEALHEMIGYVWYLASGKL